ELAVVRAGGFMPACGDHGALIEDAAGGSPAALDPAQAFHFAGLPRQRSQAGELGDLAAVERAQFWQVGHQREGAEHPDAWCQTEGVDLVAPSFALRAVQ